MTAESQETAEGVATAIEAAAETGHHGHGHHAMAS